MDKMFFFTVEGYNTVLDLIESATWVAWLGKGVSANFKRGSF